GQDLEDDLLRVEAVGEQEVLRVHLHFAALADGDGLELEEARLPAQDLSEDELGLLADDVAERPVVDLAHLHEHAPEPSGRGGGVLPLEGSGEVLLGDEPAQEEDRAERNAEGSRRGVDHASGAEDEDGMAVGARERELARRGVVRERLEEGREARVLEAAGEAHVASSGRGGAFAAGSLVAKSASQAEAGAGGRSREPCTSSQRSRRRSESCASFSIPWARTRRRRLRATATTAVRSEASSGFAVAL